MRWRRTEDDGYVDEADALVEQGGWATASTGAAANAVGLVRWVAWALLIAGPLLGLFALVTQPTVSAAPAPVKAGRSEGGLSVGVAGFAEQYVAAYVRAGEGTEASLAPFYPDIRDVVLQAKPGARLAEQVSSVRVREVSAGYWAVTVAARVTEESDDREQDQAAGGEAGAQGWLRYFQVPVKDGGKGALVAAALPAEVSAPVASEGAVLAYGPAQEAVRSAPLVQTLEAVFGAYLAGSGELDRYASPGTAISPVVPAPYTAVTVQRVAEVGTRAPLVADAKKAPQDGQRRQLLVHLEATAKSGSVWPLTYALELRARDGRWEMAALEVSPVLESSSSEGEQ